MYAANGVVRGLNPSVTKRTCVNEFLLGYNYLSDDTVFYFCKM
jgi:hypothetical protein